MAAISLFDYSVIVRHALEARVLLLREGAVWSLPHWATADRHYWHLTEFVIRTVRDQLGLEATVLRCLENRHEAATGRVRRVYALETHGPLFWSPPAGGRWVGEKE